MKDETGEANRKAKEVVRELYRQAATEPDGERRSALAKHAARSDNDRRIAAMLELASTEPELALAARDINKDPWLLVVANGVINLKTGELRPHSREDLMTNLAPVTFDPAVTAPRWIRLIEDVTKGDAELAKYLQKVCGYSLTGDTSEQAFFLLSGAGANGKSTFLETLRHVMGDYARHSDFSTFLSGRDDAVRADIARLSGARLVTAVEAEIGRRLNETVLKMLTGGDTVTARQLYQSHAEFVPQFKLLFATNHRPRIRGTDEAIWRRVRSIPFLMNLRPNKRDPGLKERLRGELSGILNWALEGCQAWQSTRLAEPDSIRSATLRYRNEEDIVGEFISERCRERDGAQVEKGKFHSCLIEWCRREGGEPQLSNRELAHTLRDRGLADRQSNGVRYWVGIELRDEQF